MFALFMQLSLNLDITSNTILGNINLLCKIMIFYVKIHLVVLLYLLQSCLHLIYLNEVNYLNNLKYQQVWKFYIKIMILLQTQKIYFLKPLRLVLGKLNTSWIEF